MGKYSPPSDVWVYIDRVACFKNGDTSIKPDSVQAYAQYYWDKMISTKETNFIGFGVKNISNIIKIDKI